MANSWDEKECTKSNVSTSAVFILICVVSGTSIVFLCCYKGNRVSLPKVWQLNTGFVSVCYLTEKTL